MVTALIYDPTTSILKFDFPKDHKSIFVAKIRGGQREYEVLLQVTDKKKHLKGGIFLNIKIALRTHALYSGTKKLF